jgi:dTDP-4-amino-4,6-dideoxygalactose transaminase
MVGGNHRLDALQAAVLAVKLGHMDDWTGRRRAAAARYRELLPAELLDWPGADDPQAEVHHLFPLLVDDRDAVLDALAGEGIAAGVHYRRALPQTPAFAGSADACPVAADRAARQLSLPMHPHLPAAAVERVVDAVVRATR